MPSTYGFENDEDREKDRREREARHTADHQHASALASQHGATIALILTDLADADKKALGHTQVERGLSGHPWLLVPRGWHPGSTSNDWILSVTLSVTDQQPRLTITSRAGDSIPPQNIDRLREVLEASTSIPATVEGVASTPDSSQNPPTSPSGATVVL